MTTFDTLGEPSVRRTRAAFTRSTKNLSIPLVTTEVDPEDPKKYTALLEGQYEHFMGQFKGAGAESSAIHHGFMVVGLVAKQVPRAYADFLAAHSETADYGQLHAATEQGFKQLIEPLADTDNRRNKTLETWIGIHHDDPEQAQTALEFTRMEGKLISGVRPIITVYSSQEIVLREMSGDLEPKDPTKKCPALEYILPKLWSTVIAGCIILPEYFPHDVNRALSGQKK